MGVNMANLKIKGAPGELIQLVCVFVYYLLIIV
ncbi:uncharacterized protein METZ01_LOCUS198865, partial [marine metagenome]